MLTEANADAFARLVDDMRAAARESMGPDHDPVLILQLTHAGRYSRPGERPAPVLAHHSPALDASRGLPADYPLITDEELDRLQDDFVRSARLAARVGFDGVDVKACHGYLLGGLLAAFTRSGSRYGGPAFEDRTRMVCEVARPRRVRCARPDHRQPAEHVRRHAAPLRLGRRPRGRRPAGPDGAAAAGRHPGGAGLPVHQHHRRQPLLPPALQPPVRRADRRRAAPARAPAGGRGPDAADRAAAAGGGAGPSERPGWW